MNNELLKNFYFDLNLKDLTLNSEKSRSNISTVISGLEKLLDTRKASYSKSLAQIHKIDAFLKSIENSNITVADARNLRDQIKELRQTLKTEAPIRDKVIFKLVGNIFALTHGEINKHREILQRTLLLNTLKDYINDMLLNLSQTDLIKTEEDLKPFGSHLEKLRKFIIEIENKPDKDFSKQTLNRINEELYQLGQAAIELFKSKSADLNPNQKLALQRFIATNNECGLYIEEICRKHESNTKWSELNTKASKTLFIGKSGFVALSALLALSFIVLGVMVLFPPAGMGAAAVFLSALAVKAIGIAILATGIGGLVGSVVTRLYEKVHYHRPFSLANAIKSIPPALGKGALITVATLVFPVKLLLNFAKTVANIKKLTEFIASTALPKTRDFITYAMKSITTKLGITKIEEKPTKTPAEEKTESNLISNRPPVNVGNVEETNKQAGPKNKNVGPTP